MSNLDKDRIRDLAFRLYYTVDKETNSYLYRNPKKAWRHIKPYMRAWWIEVAETLDRTIQTYNDDDWEEPDIPEPDDETDPPSFDDDGPPDDDPEPMAA